jgi:hypothetical protein
VRTRGSLLLNLLPPPLNALLSFTREKRKKKDSTEQMNNRIDVRIMAGEGRVYLLKMNDGKLA